MISGLNYLKLEFCFLKSIPFLGAFFYSFINIIKYRKKFNNSIYITLNEFDLLAAVMLNKILTLKVDIYFLQRSDLIIKSYIELKRSRNVFTKIKYRLRIKLIEFIYNFCLPKITKSIVQTKYHKERLIKLNPSLSMSISIVPNNVNTSWVKLDSTETPMWFYKNSDTYNLGVISNLFYKIKGFDLLIDSISLIRDLNIHIYIIGDGIDRELIKSKFQDEGLSNITTFVGRVDNASSFMTLFDLILIPTHYDDCPNVVLEAMYNKINMVATDIDAHKFLLGDSFPLVQQDAFQFSESIRHNIEGNELDLKQALMSVRVNELSFDWGAKMLSEFNLNG